MMESPRDAIRRLLKTFGIQADEAITTHIEQALAAPEIKIRLTLTDVTDYGDSPPASKLSAEIEGTIPVK